MGVQRDYGGVWARAHHRLRVAARTQLEARAVLGGAARGELRLGRLHLRLHLLYLRLVRRLQ
eukprot:3045865-Prymnesium_polylepis.1